MKGPMNELVLKKMEAKLKFKVEDFKTKEVHVRGPTQINFQGKVLQPCIE